MKNTKASVCAFAILASACATFGGDEVTEDLATYLKVPYHQRLKSSLKRGDDRYLLIPGYAVSVPCAPDDATRGVEPNERNFQWLALTQDHEGSDDYPDLMSRLFDYDCEYNRSLASELLSEAS